MSEREREREREREKSVEREREKRVWDVMAIKKNVLIKP
jgi:hypothetical protein